MKQSHIFRFPNGYIYAVLDKSEAINHIADLKKAGFSVKSEINGVATFYTLSFNK